VDRQRPPPKARVRTLFTKNWWYALMAVSDGRIQGCQPNTKVEKLKRDIQVQFPKKLASTVIRLR
jgi:hypothetical protein